jgi:hypothetical protein
VIGVAADRRGIKGFERLARGLLIVSWTGDMAHLAVGFGAQTVCDFPWPSGS